MFKVLIGRACIFFSSTKNSGLLASYKYALDKKRTFNMQHLQFSVSKNFAHLFLFLLIEAIFNVISLVNRILISCNKFK